MTTSSILTALVFYAVLALITFIVIEIVMKIKGSDSDD